MGVIYCAVIIAQKSSTLTAMFPRCKNSQSKYLIHTSGWGGDKVSMLTRTYPHIPLRKS